MTEAALDQLHLHPHHTAIKQGQIKMTYRRNSSQRLTGYLGILAIKYITEAKTNSQAKRSNHYFNRKAIGDKQRGLTIILTEKQQVIRDLYFSYIWENDSKHQSCKRPKLLNQPNQSVNTQLTKRSKEAKVVNQPLIRVSTT